MKTFSHDVIQKPYHENGGLVLHGFDTGTTNPTDFTALAGLIAEHGVVILPGTTLTEDEQIAFTRLLNVAYGGNHDDDMKVTKITNKTDRGEYPLPWHQDTAFENGRPHVGILQGVKISPDNVPTWFCRLDKLFEALPECIQKICLEAYLFCDGVKFQYGRWRHGEPASKDPKDWPGYVRPMVEVIDGVPYLYIGQRNWTEPATTRIMGMERKESDRIMNVIWARMDTFASNFAVHWEEKTLVFWDNRRTAHQRPHHPNAKTDPETGADTDVDTGVRELLRTSVAEVEPSGVPYDPAKDGDETAFLAALKAKEAGKENRAAS